MSRMLAMTLGEKLHKLCNEKGWTQSRLLKAVPGASKSSMSNWFSGKHRPDLESAMAIARILGVPLDYLADDDQDDPPAPALPKDEEDVLDFYRSLKRTGHIDKDTAITGLAIAAKLPQFNEGDIGETKRGVMSGDEGQSRKRG